MSEYVGLVKGKVHDKREVCAAHNLVYPPSWWMRAYFDDGLVLNPNNPPKEVRG